VLPASSNKHTRQLNKSLMGFEPEAQMVQKLAAQTSMHTRNWPDMSWLQNLGGICNRL
jgi:hypothetical protein